VKRVCVSNPDKSSAIARHKHPGVSKQGGFRFKLWLYCQLWRNQPKNFGGTKNL